MRHLRFHSYDDSCLHPYSHYDDDTTARGWRQPSTKEQRPIRFSGLVSSPSKYCSSFYFLSTVVVHTCRFVCNGRRVTPLMMSIPVRCKNMNSVMVDPYVVINAPRRLYLRTNCLYVHGQLGGYTSASRVLRNHIPRSSWGAIFLIRRISLETLLHTPADGVMEVTLPIASTVAPTRLFPRLSSAPSILFPPAPAVLKSLT